MAKAYLETNYQKLNLGQQVAVWEDGLRTSGKEGEFEWWHYDAQMTDGTTITITFFTNDPTAGSAGFSPCVQVDMTNPDGTQINDRLLFDAENCYFSPKHCHIRMGINQFMGDLDQYRIYVRTSKLTAKITLKSRTKPWRPATGFQQYGDDGYFAWLPAVSEGATEADIVINGQEKHYHGTGYHDHNWGNVSLISILHHWYWGRAKIGPYTAINCYITSTKKYDYHHFPFFMLAKGNQLVCDNPANLRFHQLDPHYSHRTRKHYHQKLIYEYQGDEGHYRITYYEQKDVSSFSLLGDQQHQPSFFKVGFVRLTGIDPTYDRFNGEAVLEKIENGKVVEKYQSPATWELMYFKPDRNV